MGQQSRWTITEEAASIQDLPDDIWYGKVHQEGLGGIRTRIGRTLKANPGMSPAQASKRVMSSIDRDILSGKARTHSTSNIPARPFVMFQDEDIDAIYDVFQTWLGERAFSAGWVL
jgi:phage gpG-like protein